jgi:hypothetical protein
LEAGERRREVGDRVGPTGCEREGGKGREGGGGWEIEQGAVAAGPNGPARVS